MNTDQFVLEFLTDHKAQDLVNISVKKRSDVTDNMIIASGTSSRQVKSLAENLIAHCKQSSIQVFGSEGRDYWVLVDLGEVLVHIMQVEAREYYQLEKLWQQ